MEGTVQDSFRILLARSCPPIVRHTRPPKMSAEKVRGSLAWRPPTLKTESKSVASGFASAGKRSVEKEGGVLPHGIVE